jgi:energy-coupling factor transporter transmembrane protein EcfT
LHNFCHFFIKSNIQLYKLHTYIFINLFTTHILCISKYNLSFFLRFSYVVLDIFFIFFFFNINNIYKNNNNKKKEDNIISRKEEDKLLYNINGQINNNNNIKLVI